METTLVDWDRALVYLRENGASGRGSTSSFRGKTSDGRYLQIADGAGAFEWQGRMMSAGSAVSMQLKELGLGKRPASDDNRGYVRPPRFAIPGYYGPSVYIDVKSAYHSIYSRIEWELSFLPSKLYIKNGLTPLSALELPTKRAKVAPIGMALSRKGFVWKDGAVRSINRVSGFYNPQVAWYCWAVLGAIARRLRSAGAVYFNTDGAIMRMRDVSKGVAIIREAGLKYSIKSSGKAIVWGIGSYTIGEVGHARKFDQPKHILPDVIPSELAYRHHLNVTFSTRHSDN